MQMRTKGDSLTILGTFSTSSNWSIANDTVISIGPVEYVDIHSDGVYPIVAYKNTADNKAYLHRFSGASKWYVHGGTTPQPISSGTANYISVLRGNKDDNGFNQSSFVAYSDVDYASNATVKKVDDVDFVIGGSGGPVDTVGDVGFTDTLGIFGAGYFSTLGTDTNDNVYMTFNSLNEYRVMQLLRLIEAIIVRGEDGKTSIDTLAGTLQMSTNCFP